MLTKLYIENYALIDHLEIDFSTGFTVITGETGAGKSILLGALSLILGQRADSGVLLDQGRKCIVEGDFRIRGYELEELFKSSDLDYSDSMILRREVTPNGKSRAFINDTPVNLALLKDLGDRLVNIHSQNTITTLNDADFQLSVLDDFAGNLNVTKEYREKYAGFLEMKQQLVRLTDEENKAKADLDYHNFLLDELAAADLREDEQKELEEKLEVLGHSEEIKGGLGRIMQDLSEGESNAVNSLSSILSVLKNLSRFHSSLKDLSARVESDLIDLKDIATAVSRLEQDISYDPEEMQRLSSRLDLIYRLQKKHHAATVSELLVIKKDLEEKIRNAGSMEERLAALKESIEVSRRTLTDRAERISASRKKVIRVIEGRIKETLNKLAIPDANFRVELVKTETLTRDGTDRVRFLFSANKGIDPDEVSNIASGGELSRLMLSIKSMISQKNLLPTIIFDEIDSGVSGDVAGKIGNILKDMGKAMQVVAITHLPQIAGKGEHHFRVFKESDGATARSLIKKLNKNERIHEIAKMVSDEKVTDAAMKAARELLN